VAASVNARVLAAAAQARVAHGEAVTSPAVRRLVGRGLARDVTVPTLIELRALQAHADGDLGREQRLFDLSEAISRRSLPTHLWRIQRAVDHGDVRGALEDFDLALRTSTAAPGILFPVLTGALSDPGLSEPIARLVARPSDWRESFLHYAMTDGGAAADVGRLALRIHDPRAFTAAGLDQVLVGRLVADAEFELARRVQDRFRPPPLSERLLRDPNFADATAGPPFGWRLVQGGDMGAERSRTAGGSALSFQSSPAAAGPVAVQLLTLPPGDYRLAVRTASGIDPASLPYWTVTCAQAGGGQLAILDQPADTGAEADVGFTAPPDCSAQWLALNLRASESQDRTGAIAWVRIVGDH
jgi:hypothetical protein